MRPAIRRAARGVQRPTKVGRKVTLSRHDSPIASQRSLQLAEFRGHECMLEVVRAIFRWGIWSRPVIRRSDSTAYQESSMECEVSAAGYVSHGLPSADDVPMRRAKSIMWFVANRAQQRNKLRGNHEAGSRTRFSRRV